MSIREHDWSLSERGRKDAKRHREKIKEAIRKKVREIIADQSIITRRGKKKIKIPVRGLKSYRFKYDQRQAGGMGQGQGEEGDVIGRRPNPQGKPGQAGERPGIDYFETEVDIEEIIAMALEDMGLPNLKKKDIAQIPILRGWKPDRIDKSGIPPNILKKRTIKEAIKRTAQFVRALMADTGKPEELCYWALWMAKGNIEKAKEILASDKLPTEEELTKVKPYIFNPDLRFKVMSEDVEYESNAVVFAMMDTSGSMTEYKKYIARIFFWWMVQFLKLKYENVDIRFIAHHTEAKLVTEDEFFHKGESGGTFCWSAYELAHHLTETEYDPQSWNIYAFHFSDGEDWEPERTVEVAQKLLPRCNMIGYGEIQQGGFSWSRLMQTFEKALGAKTVQKDPRIIVKDFKETFFMGTIIKDKKDVWPALKIFFKMGGGKNES